MDDYIAYLSKIIPERDSLKLVKTEAKKYFTEHSARECYEIYTLLYESDDFQIQEIGVSWRDIQRMSFLMHCTFFMAPLAAMKAGRFRRF